MRRQKTKKRENKNTDSRGKKKHHAHAAYVVAAPPMVPPDPFVLKLAEFEDTQETYILKTPLYDLPISSSTWQLYTDATRPYRCGAILFF